MLTISHETHSTMEGVTKVYDIKIIVILRKLIMILGGTSFFSFFRSGHRGSKAYSLWDGVVPNPSIGYDYL